MNKESLLRNNNTFEVAAGEAFDVGAVANIDRKCWC